MQQFCTYGSVRGASGKPASLPRQKPSRLKSALHGHSYVIDSPCGVGVHACGSRMLGGFFSNLLGG
jgi:hypothetical protein